MHWVHADADHPKAVQYREAIRHHYLARTTGNDPVTENGITYRRDHWWKEYCGREYEGEHGRPGGLELPSTHFEMWETPEEIMKNSSKLNPNHKNFRETFSLIHTIFDQEHKPEPI